MDVEWIAETIAINGISYLVLNSLPLPINFFKNLFFLHHWLLFLQWPSNPVKFPARMPNFANLRPISQTLLRNLHSKSSAIQKQWMPSMRPTKNTRTEFTRRLVCPGSCPFLRHGMRFGRTHYGWLEMHYPCV